MGPEFRLELTSSVHGNCGGGTKAGDPAIDESAGNSLCSDARDGDGFWPSRESINAGEEIGTSFRRWKWSNEVDVDVVKASIEACEGRQWSNGVTMNLQALTLNMLWPTS